MENIIVREGQELEWSFDDMKGCFYLFSMPEAWSPYFAFRDSFRARDLELWHLPPEEEIWLGSATVPMGWRNAMGLIQYAHRRAHLMPIPSGLAPLPQQREVRKDKPLPPTSLNASALQEIWSVYCDDADVPRLVPISPTARAAGSSPLQDIARGRFNHFELLMSKKCGTREALVKRLGAYINCKAGIMWAGGGRLALFARLLGHVLSQVAPGRKPLQVVGGHWNHIAGFRREISACFNQFWAYVSSGKESLGPVWLPVLREAAEALILLPLAQFDLCAPLVDFVAATDASETGGGLCVAHELTSLGTEWLFKSVAAGLTRGRDILGIITADDGLGGLRRALELQSVEVTVHAEIGASGLAVSAQRSQWPSILFLDPDAVDYQDKLAGLFTSFVHLRRVIAHCSLVPCFKPGLAPEEIVARSLGRITVLKEAVGVLQRSRSEILFSFLVSGIPRPTVHGPLEGGRLPDLLQLEVSRALGVAHITLSCGSWTPTTEDCDYWVDWPLEEDFQQVLGPLGAARTFTPAGTYPAWAKRCDSAKERRKFKVDPRSIAIARGYGWYSLVAAGRRGCPAGKQAAYRLCLATSACAAPPLGLLVGPLLKAEGIRLSLPSPDECWGQLDAEERDFAEALLCPGDVLSTQDSALAEALAVFVRCSRHSGSDIRAADSSLLSPVSWPRRSVDPDLFNWKVKLAVKYQSKHINVLELRAILLGLQWLLRKPANFGHRAVFVCDSQVCIAVLAKGRSSARTIAATVKKVIATILAGSLCVYFVYVESSRNPADRPSRFSNHGKAS